jgi:hypothetical protein
VEEGRKGETHARACLPHLVRCGVARRGEARRGVQVHDVRVRVCVNNPPKSDPKPRKSATSFCHLFFAMSPCLICFDRDRASRLWNIVTPGGSSL